MTDTATRRAAAGHVDDLVAAYALGALEPAEIAAIEDHLLVCDACAGLVDDVRGTVSLLAFSARPGVPAPAVKAALFARVSHAQQAAAAEAPTVNGRRQRQGRRQRAERATPPQPSSSPWVADEIPRRDRSPVATPPRRQTRWARIAGPIAMVPLVVALALLGGWSVQLQGEIADRDAEVRTLQAENDAIDAILTGGGGGVRVELSSNAAAPSSASGTIVADPGGREARLMAYNMAPDARYALWGRRGSELDWIGDFETDEQGAVLTTVTLERALANYRSVHVRAHAGAAPGDLAIGTGIDTGDGASTSGADVLSAEIDSSVGSPLDETDSGLGS